MNKDLVDFVLDRAPDFDGLIAIQQRALAFSRESERREFSRRKGRVPMDESVEEIFRYMREQYGSRTLRQIPIGELHADPRVLQIIRSRCEAHGIAVNDEIIDESLTLVQLGLLEEGSTYPALQHIRELGSVKANALLGDLLREADTQNISKPYVEDPGAYEEHLTTLGQLFHGKETVTRYVPHQEHEQAQQAADNQQLFDLLEDSIRERLGLLSVPNKGYYVRKNDDADNNAPVPD